MVNNKERRTREIRVQLELFKRCSAATALIVERHSPMLRDIMEEYYDENNCVPPVDKLQWYASERIGHDITKEM